MLAIEDEGWGKEFFLGPHSPSTTGPLLPEGKGDLLMMDFETSTYHGSLCQDSFLKNQIKKTVVDIQIKQL